METATLTMTPEGYQIIPLPLLFKPEEDCYCTTCNVWYKCVTERSAHNH